jgi:hypothetical protein
MDYPTFVSATFHANGQNKRLMVKEVVDKAWVVSVKSHKHMLDDDKVSGLLKQVCNRVAPRTYVNNVTCSLLCVCTMRCGRDISQGKSPSRSLVPVAQVRRDISRSTKQK